jgi:hypothetical protein
VRCEPGRRDRGNGGGDHAGNRLLRRWILNLKGRPQMDTILEVHNGTIDINELTKRLDEMIPPIKIEEENDNGKISQ